MSNPRDVGHVGRTDLLDLGDGATAARAIEQPHQRQAVFRRHLFELRVLLVVITLGRATAHGEIVRTHDDGPAVDRAAATEAARRAEVDQLARVVVARVSREAAPFAE